VIVKSSDPFLHFHILHSIDRPRISNLMPVERCVSNISVTWNDDTPCTPVQYGVTLFETEKSDTTSKKSYNFSKLNSSTSYTVIVNGTSSNGQSDDVTMTFKTLQSNGKFMYKRI